MMRANIIDVNSVPEMPVTRLLRLFAVHAHRQIHSGNRLGPMKKYSMDGWGHFVPWIRFHQLPCCENCILVKTLNMNIATRSQHLPKTKLIKNEYSKNK